MYQSFWIILFVLFPWIFISGQNHAGDVSAQYGSGNNLLLNFYQKVLSPVKGGNQCPMYPSCSQYSKLAFEKLSLSTAFVKTFDRIMRCGHDPEYYAEINVNNSVRWYDPPNSSQIPDSAAESLPSMDSKSPEFTRLDDKFASYLFESNDFRRASTEYLRLRFYETDSVKKIYYLFKSGLCEYRAGNFNDYISFAVNNRTEFLRFPQLKLDLEYHIGKSYFELKDYTKAINAFDEVELANSSSMLRDEIFFYRGMSYARLFFWDEALKNMKNINQHSQNSLRAEKLIKRLPEAKNLPEKSPFLAGLASAIIPGSGYLYANRTGTAITSFIVNSLLTWTIYSAVKKDNYGLAALTFFFGSGWYVGNIYGSSQAAREFNIKTRNDFIDNILNEK